MVLAAVVQQGISAVSLDPRRIQTMSLSRQQIPHQAETEGCTFKLCCSSQLALIARYRLDLLVRPSLNHISVVDTTQLRCPLEALGAASGPGTALLDPHCSDTTVATGPTAALQRPRRLRDAACHSRAPLHDSDREVISELRGERK